MRRGTSVVGRWALFAGLVLVAGAGCDSGPTQCVSARDCSGSGLVCDFSQGVCVECVADADCFGESEVCLANSCESVTPCVTSRECPGQVCDEARGYCVDCVTDVDCPGELVCEDSACVDPPTPCVSDRECSALSLVCNQSLGICVECVRAADCAEGMTCSNSRCAAVPPSRQDGGPRTDGGRADAGTPRTDGGTGSDGGTTSPDAGAGETDGGNGECTADCALDVVVLLDVTGSHHDDLVAARAMLQTELLEPLLAAGDVRVGIAYYGDFPISPYGEPSDRPFVAGAAPTTSPETLQTAFDIMPDMHGGDYPEALVQALFELTGGTPHADSLSFSCASGEPGACWRAGARKAILVYTDAPTHNGPDGRSPYLGSVGAATWSMTRARMIDGRFGYFLHLDTSADAIPPSEGPQAIATDLGESLSEVTVEAPSADWTPSTRGIRAALLRYYGL